MPIHDTPDSALSRQWLLPVFAGLMVALVLAQTEIHPRARIRTVGSV